MTLLEYLQVEHPEDYPDSVLRTLERRVKEWKALHGGSREVMFRQTHPPGQQGLSDFTRLKGVCIVVAGKPLVHLLYHFRLAFSGWSFMKVILGGESFTALAEGLQEALWRLGGAPREHRTDSLSSAFKNLSPQAQQDITARYQQLCEAYQLKATRNNPGACHENGSIESPHGHLKRRIKQALLLRGSHAFDSLADYQQWLEEVVQQHNRRNAKAIHLEREHLQPLPMTKAVDFTELCVRVSCASTIDVRRTTYTVPSRLIGECLRIHLYHDRLECYLGNQLSVRLPRVYPMGQTQRARCVDYRHVIDSLVKKPQAFRYSQLREELLPNPTYRALWQQVDRLLAPRAACQWMVGVLHLAATHTDERQLGEYLAEQLQQGHCPSLPQLQHQFGSPASPDVPVIEVKQHALSAYNHLLAIVEQEVCHGHG